MSSVGEAAGQGRQMTSLPGGVDADSPTGRPGERVRRAKSGRSRRRSASRDRAVLGDYPTSGRLKLQERPLFDRGARMKRMERATRR